MLNLIKINQIPIFNERSIINDVLLSDSFGTICKKITLDNHKEYVIKFYSKKNFDYNSIYYEGKSLEFMYKKFPNYFPKIFYYNKNIIVIEYIKNNNVKNENYEKQLAIKIAEIHSNNNNQYGFFFDTPIGGLKQPSHYGDSWVDFYRKNRLGMIFDEINNNNPMPQELNKGIENILKNLKNFIPDNPKASLIHGDLWEGNILFHDCKLVCLIDPGIGYAHNEMEIAYLKWFNYIGNNFYNYYSEIINIDKDFFNYSGIYELYYSLLNVHLWSREYLKNAFDIVKKYN